MISRVRPRPRRCRSGRWPTTSTSCCAGARPRPWRRTDVAPLAPTPSQTVGPFFAIGLPWSTAPELVAPDAPGRGPAAGRIVFDGDGAPVDDALIEIWQANRGRPLRPPRGHARGASRSRTGFRGFGRCRDRRRGAAIAFVTVKPGPVPAPGRRRCRRRTSRSSVFARGLLKRLVTRIYFPDEAEANAADPVLSSVAAGRAREPLVARRGATACCASTSTSRATTRPSSLPFEASSAALRSRTRAATRRPTAPGCRRCSTSRRRWRARRRAPGVIPEEAAAAIAAACRADALRSRRSSAGRPRARRQPGGAAGRGAHRRGRRGARGLRAPGRDQPGRARHGRDAGRRARAAR